MIASSRRTYLDHAAATPVRPAALRAFLRANAQAGNPSSPHAEGREAQKILEDARQRIARVVGTKADAVLFTSGATEANTLAIVGHVRALDTTAPLHVLYLPSAHASVLGAIETLEGMGVSCEPLSLTEGAIDLQALERQVRAETVLVVVDVVCGETGVLYNVRDVRRVLDRVRKDGPRIRLFADASQAPRVTSIELEHLGADMLSLDAQKIGGVRGLGVLVAPRAVPLSPLVRGGGQERGLRPGTEPVALAAACATALEECVHARASFVARAQRMREMLMKRLPPHERNEGKHQAPHILNISLPGRDTDYLVALLDAAGYAVSTKSACESDEAGSRAVYAMTGDASRAESTLRISWGPDTTEKELQRAASAVTDAVRFIGENAIY